MSRFFYPYAEHEEDGRPIPGPSDWWRRVKVMKGNGRQRSSRDIEDAGQGVKMAEDAVEWGEQVIAGAIAERGVYGRRKRQDTTGTSVFSSASVASSTSTAPLFVPPASTSSTSSTRASASSSSSSSATSSLNPSSSLSSSTLFSASPTLSTSPSASSRSFTSLWSTTRTRSATASATPSFVPGVTFPLTLSGTRDDEAIYAVQVDVGHGAVPGTASYAWMQDEQGTDGSQESREARRQVANTGEGYQRVNLQVDLGSSDMWVATRNCTTSDCRSAPALLDASGSITSGVTANMTYHSGSVSGTIMWEEVQLDTFAIAYQAFIAGDSVMNENLGGGNFSGVLGMALPANSIISSQIPGTTSSNPDGATFLDNLFGSGALAPTQRIFSLALERREDVRTISLLTIGSVYDKYCPSPCNPSYIPIIANPNLGIIGYLHWRIPLMGVRYTTWDDAQRGTGPNVQSIQLGPSLVVSSRSQPLAVLDSGGVAVLVGHKPYADAIYGAYGISASQDGYYRMSCKTQLAFSFNFGGTWYAAHPLDMSWPDPTDPSQSTCIGAIQYAPSLSEAGDFIFGSSFLKNAYTIFSYPDQLRNVTWQPTVGLIGLTNASVASQDFYAVRTLRQSLAQVSSQGPFFGGSSSPTSPSSVPITSSAAGGSVVNTTAIVAGSVVGFFVLAAVAFSAWWFFLRRKYGSSGYPLAMTPRGRGDDDSSLPPTESTRRSKKHAEALRQKSMIEGYSDYEGDSWTEGADSMRLGYLPEVPEEGGMEDMRMGKREGSVGSSSMRITREISEKDGMGAGGAVDPGLLGETDIASGNMSSGPFALASPLVPITSTRSQSSSRPAPESDTYPPSLTSPTSASTSAPLIPYPQPRSASSSRRDHVRTKSTSLSMSGPFPSSMAWQRAGDLDNISPMYEIRSEDYFEVEPRGRRGSSVGMGGNRQCSRDRGQG